MSKFIFTLFTLFAVVQGAFCQLAKPTVSLATMLDLRNRQPVSNETVEVRHGSVSNLWQSPRIFVHYPLSSEPADNVFVTTNKSNVGRYVATDKGSGVFDVRLFGAIPNDDADDTDAITAAGAALQAANGGVLVAEGGKYLVKGTGYPVITFTGLTNVTLETATATFVNTNYTDATFTSIGLTESSGIATATWASPHGLSAGSRFCIKSSTDAQYEGTWIVATSNSPTVLTFALGAYNRPTGPAYALAHVSDINQVLFRFDGCTNINLGKITFSGTVLPRDVQYWIGVVVGQFRKNCRTIRGEINVSGASYGLWSGEYANQSLGGCTDFNVDIAASGVGYPISLWGSGHASKFRVVCDNIHRMAYVGGVRQSDFDLKGKNFDIAGVIATHQPDVDGTLTGCEDSTFRVVDTGTTEPIKLLATGGTRWLAILNGYSGTNDVSHRNLRFYVSCKDAPVTGGFLLQTFATNQYVSGLTVNGYMDQRGLNGTTFRYPHFIYETSANAGHISGLAFKDFTVLQPADIGPYASYLRAVRMDDSVLFDDYQSTVAVSTALPAGIHVDTVPRFPDWQYSSYEAAQSQKVSGAARLSATESSRVIGTLAAPAGTNDLTLQWVGKMPYNGDSALFTISTAQYSTNRSLGVSVISGSLIVRLYGASTTDWRSASVPNWLSTVRGRVTSVGIVRNADGLRVYTDGHLSPIVESTAGTAPNWTDSIDGTLMVLGADDPGGFFDGPVYRAAAWNYDRSADFPALAVKWDSGEIPLASQSDAISITVNNGSFETLGSGVGDVFANWDETVAGSSTLSVSTNAISGTNSMRMSVDSGHSFAGIGQTVMTPGLAYRVSLWARAPNGGSNPQLAVVGPIDNEYIINLSTAWKKFVFTKIWGSFSFALKRWNLASNDAEVDDIVIAPVGALLDYDWTRSPADQITGKFAEVLGGSATRITARGHGISDNLGDTSISLEPGRHAPVQHWSTDITGARTVTFDTNASIRGDTFRLIRKDNGAGTLTAALSPTRVVHADEWLDVAYDGTNWIATASGSVSGNGLTLTERAEPAVPQSATAAIWLEEADTSKSIKVKWPDGSNTALYPQAGGSGITNTVEVLVFTNSGIYVKPSNVKLIRVIAIGGGGGGGSGRRGTNSPAAQGGSGGSGGAMAEGFFSPSEVGTNETVTVGTGGGGAPGILTDSTDGISGTNGTGSYFGSLVWGVAGPGGPGGLGTGSAANSTVNASMWDSGPGGAGGGGSAANTPTTVQNRPGGAGGGGGGGGISTAGVTNHASRGGHVYNANAYFGGDGGTVAGVNGTNGVSNTGIARPGTGGGGGTPGFSTVGNGGNGGWPGGGGGGGAGCKNGVTSGAGGNGAKGAVWVFNYY